MERESALDRYFRVAAPLQSSTPTRLRYYCEYLFDGIGLAGKNVLDVGGGIGVYSMFAASCGAARVVCLEPTADGSSGTSAVTFEEMRTTLDLPRAEFLPYRLQEYDARGDTFDVILLHDSINHLDEHACARLGHDEEAVRSYQGIFRSLAELARTGSALIITDVSRSNFFVTIHRVNPFIPSIDWDKHQSPECWAGLLAEAGFREPRLRWTTPRRFGRAGQVLLGNQWGTYFLTSAFCLTMRR
jgi:hypothetical protein